VILLLSVLAKSALFYSSEHVCENELHMYRTMISLV